MVLTKSHLGLLLALFISNALVLFGQAPLWDGPRFGAAVALLFILPGWAWLPLLDWMQTRRGIERLLLVVGVASILSALALLITVFIPGPFSEGPVLIALNLLTLSGLIAQLIRHRLTTPRASPAGPFLTIEWPSRTLLLILLSIITIAAVTRLTRIGYAEFHEDELENMRLILRAYKGEEYAPFLDSKGPIHWLLPAALWYLNGWINEGIARAPFAITSLLLIPLMYALGRRLSHGSEAVGLAAAAFVALNGFFVALARHVEIRAVLIFWGALATWCAYRYYKENLNSCLLYGTIIYAVGLIAHPLMILYAPVLGYALLLKLWQQPGTWRQQMPRLVGAGLLFATLTAAFYVPYFTDPNIDRVYEYFASERVGESLLYNRVDNMLGEDELYSSRFHGPILLLLLTWLLARHFSRLGRLGWGLFLGGGLLILTTVWQPQAWIVNGVNLAFVPYAGLALIFLLLPRTPFEIKLAMVWFIVPFGALLFLAQDASNHIQMAYTGWSLLAALALVDLWLVLNTAKFFRARPFIRWGLAVSLVPLILLILSYQYLSFDAQVTTYWQAKIASANSPDSIYNQIYRSIPRPRKIIANPRLSGWKSVGYLWETGTLSGDFRSINESFAVPIWYTFQTPRSCYEDPAHYWVRRSWDGWPEAEQLVIEQGYTLTRIVRVDQDPKLHLYEKKVETSGAVEKPEILPEILDVDEYRRSFDRLATPARFAQEASGQQKTAFNFGGDRLRLIGYDLPPDGGRPGDLLPVTLYWETLAPMETRYRAFMHLVDESDQLWGQHDDDPACRLLTNEMRPGQRSARQFRIPVDPATPSGLYSIRLGLYDPDTLERLGIWDAQAEQPAGDSLVLGRVEIN